MFLKPCVRHLPMSLGRGGVIVNRLGIDQETDRLGALAWTFRIRAGRAQRGGAPRNRGATGGSGLLTRCAQCSQPFAQLHFGIDAPPRSRMVDIRALYPFPPLRCSTSPGPGRGFAPGRSSLSVRPGADFFSYPELSTVEMLIASGQEAIPSTQTCT